MSCYCLCVVNHPNSPGICTGKGVGKLRFSDFPADSGLAKVESVDVLMCKPCWEKTLDERRP